MPRQLNIEDKYYKHLERVEWPKDLLGPNYWIPGENLTWGLPNDLSGIVKGVTASGRRFYQKVKHLPAQLIPGDKTDPDAIHALQFALNRQDELETAIKASKEHQPLMLWLQERKRSHVKSMQAVVVAEEGEMYDLANQKLWEVRLAKMTNEEVDHLRFIFRTVMARIDIVPTRESDTEKIQPIYKEAIVQLDKDSMIECLAPPSVSFWKIDDSLVEKSTLKMRQAASALYHQGRVLGACWAKLPDIKQGTSPPVTNIIIRAMHLTIRSIDLVWIERKQDLPKVEEERLLAWLRERKNTAVEVRFALIQSNLPQDFWGRPIKIDNSGTIFEMSQGEYSPYGKLLFGPTGSL